MRNRRNYYRILHVQPDAPLEVIKAGYRTLMQKLRQHPDLGGSHWNASLINEAYATLTDPEKRARYDRELFRQFAKADLSTGKAQRRAAQAEAPPRPELSCTACKAVNPVPAAFKPDQRCVQCGSFLHAYAPRTQSACKRALARLASDDPVTFFPAPRASARLGKMLDFSPKGIRFTSPEKIAPNQVITIQGPLFYATARVVYCGPNARGGTPEHTIGVAFIDVDFTRARGNFVSVAA